jgi:C-terminal processing protease CtpA/Prc
MKETKFREVFISAGKSSSKDVVGLEFKVDRKQRKMYVDKILEGSIFVNTDLEEGDVILAINDENFRSCNDSDRKVALITCRQAKESVCLVVLKDESVLLNKKINLDESVTDLDWMVDSTTYFGNVCDYA